MAKLVENDTHLFTECGLGKEAVLETVLKKIREQRRKQKERPLTKEEVLSTDSASESTESVESSSGSPSPPTCTSQLQFNVWKHTTFISMKVRKLQKSLLPINASSFIFVILRTN